MVRSISATQGTNSHWTVQVSKSLGLAASSIGFGWLLGKMWRGSEQPLGSPNAGCLLGLLGGGVGTAVSGNPGALALGSSFCLPEVSAESIVPSHAVLKPLILDERASTYLRSAAKAVETNSTIIRHCTKEVWQELRQESAGTVAPLFLERLRTSSKIIARGISDPAELPYIKSYLQETDQILSADIKAQEDLQGTFDTILKRDPKWGNFTKQITDLFLPLNEHYKVYQTRLKTFLAVLEEGVAEEIKTSANDCVRSFQNLHTHISEIKLPHESWVANLLSILNQEVLYRASEVYHHHQEILAQKTFLTGLYSAGNFTAVPDKIKEIKKLRAAEEENQKAFDQGIRTFERTTTIFSFIARSDTKLSQYVNTMGHGTVDAAKAIRDLDNRPEALSTLAQSLYLMLVPIMGPKLSIESHLHSQVNHLSFYLQKIKESPRFKEQLRKLPKLHRETLEAFLLLKDIPKEIQGFANNLKDRLHQLESETNSRTGQPKYTDLFKNGLKEDSFDQLVKWSSEGVTKESATDFHHKMYEGIKSEGIDYSIKALCENAESFINSTTCDNLPNPALWVNAIDAFLDLLWLYPQFTRREAFIAIRKSGEEFQKFVRAIHSAPEFYRHLITNYRIYLEKLHEIINCTVLLKEKYRENLVSTLSCMVPRLELLVNIQPSKHPVRDKAIELGKKMTEASLKQVVPINDVNERWERAGKINHDRWRSINKRILKTRTLVETWTKEIVRDLELLLFHAQKFEEIEQSDQQVYLLAQRALLTLQSEIRKSPKMERKFLEALKQHPNQSSLSLLNNLSQEDKDRIRQVFQDELKTDTSTLSKALYQLENARIELESFIQLGFNDAFHQETHLRQLFDNIWSAKSLRNSIESWDGHKNVEMPLIQIEDRAIPALEDLQKALFNRITDTSKALPATSEITLQKTGYSPVDAVLEKLYLFETIFLGSTKPETARDEL